MGGAVGETVGDFVGDFVGGTVGDAVGGAVGGFVGDCVGCLVGAGVGLFLGKSTFFGVVIRVNRVVCSNVNIRQQLDYNRSFQNKYRIQLILLTMVRFRTALIKEFSDNCTNHFSQDITNIVATL